MMLLPHELVGIKIHLLTIVGPFTQKGNYLYGWCCCDCGETKLVRISRIIKHGTPRSCGCLIPKEVSTRFAKHGLSLCDGKETRLHRVWANMLARCHTKTHQSYQNYGARGITVCEEWKTDYTSFHKWALSAGYNNNLTIERVNNDGNYEPSNCTWVPKGYQGRNQRTTKLTSYDAEEIRKKRKSGMSCNEMAKDYGVSASHVKNIGLGSRWAVNKEAA